MIIGALGDILFEVSSEVVKTINNVVWSGSARYSGHKRHGTDTITEFTGLDPDKISFDITLSAYLGVNPMEEIIKIWNYERSGEAVSLAIGTHGYGKYRWSILSHKTKMQTFDKEGDITSAVVSVSLQEYLKS